MAMSFGLLKAQLKQEGKFTLDQIVWMLEKIENLEKQIEKVELKVGERINKLERAQDDHIPGGI